MMEKCEEKTGVDYAKEQFTKLVEQEWQRFYAHFKIESDYIGDSAYRKEHDRIVRMTTALGRMYIDDSAKKQSLSVLTQPLQELEEQMQQQ